MSVPVNFERTSNEKQQRRRILFVMLFFCLLFSLLGLRAYQLQVLQTKKFKKMIRNSQFQTIEFQAKRGDILDRNRKPLAISIKVPSAAVNPRVLNHRKKAALAKKLARIFATKKQTKKQFTKESRKLLIRLLQDRFFVPLKRHLSKKEVEALKKLHKQFPSFKKALKLYPDRKRFYPNRNLASHILGYTDIDGKGLAGVERYFQPLLQGKKLRIKFAHDNKGRRFLRAGWKEDERQWGTSVVLSVDKSIQFITQRAIKKAVTENRAKRGIAVVMSPETGDVLAMATYPDFDPNEFRSAELKVRTNWAVSTPYEPGSTMKPVSLAIARNLGKLRWNERIDCENGRMRIGRYTIRDDHPQKLLIPLQVMKYSSNICTAKIAMRMSKRIFHKNLLLFGFGKRTNIGLPWESRGILSKPTRWANISFANIAFGQGIAVTPIQLTTAINTIVAGGIYRKPRLYKELLNWKQEVIYRFPRPRAKRIISKAASKAVLKMMESVVEKGGTGTKAAFKAFQVGGKTGTAQKAKENGRGYGKKRIASFVGFIPATKPKLTILVVVDEPQTSNYGGVVAAPAWKEIAKASLHHVNFFLSGSLKVANQKSRRKHTRRPKQSVGKGKKKANKKVEKVPQLFGMNLRKARALAEKQKLKLVVIGRGHIRYQSPPADTIVPKSRNIVVIASRNRR